MNRTEHLLTCLAEECSEVAQRVSKALRFGLAEVQPGQPLNNAQRITDELEDLFAVAFILAEDRILRFDGISDTKMIEKRAKIQQFMEISREWGVLSE